MRKEVNRKRVEGKVKRTKDKREKVWERSIVRRIERK